jgi:hypothetical protein
MESLFPHLSPHLSPRLFSQKIRKLANVKFLFAAYVINNLEVIIY